MPQISDCIGSIEFALASIATWPTSWIRAIQASSSSSLRRVRYLPRSTGIFRAASARAAASERGAPLRLPALSCLLLDALPFPLLGTLPPPLWGRVGEGG